MIKRLLCLVLLVPLTGCIYVNVPFPKGPGPAEEQVVSGKGRAKIALVDLSGMLTVKPVGISRFSKQPPPLARFKEELDLARVDEKVVGLVIRLDSPGGSVTASDILYHEIGEFRRLKQVPVVVCVMDRAFSGGYYAALAADEIFAHPTSTVGAVGVLTVKLDVSGLLERWGVDAEVLKSGPYKDFWSPLRPSLPAEREAMQAIVDQLHHRFTTLVRERRSISQDALAEVGRGGVFGADRALELGLVDRLGYLEDAIDRVRQLAGFDEAKIIIYRQPGAVVETIYSANPPLTNTAMAAADGLMSLLETRFQYLFLP